jgi:hypothetical protein
MVKGIEIQSAIGPNGLPPSDNRLCSVRCRSRRDRGFPPRSGHCAGTGWPSNSNRPLIAIVTDFTVRPVCLTAKTSAKQNRQIESSGLEPGRRLQFAPYDRRRDPLSVQPLESGARRLPAFPRFVCGRQTPLRPPPAGDDEQRHVLRRGVGQRPARNSHDTGNSAVLLSVPCGVAVLAVFLQFGCRYAQGHDNVLPAVR